MSKPITGTVAQSYLRRRGITDVRHGDPLRFHPRCWYRGDDEDPRDRLRDAWPAIIAAVTDLDGTISGAHRTWLDPRSEERRVGKECVSKCRSRWSPYNNKKKHYTYTTTHRQNRNMLISSSKSH